MKHGDKNKGKASKASGKKAGSPGKSSKATASSKIKSVVAKAKSVVQSKTSSEKTKPAKPAGNGGGRARAEGGFSNAAVAAAFKTAVKKYPNAFRKLTD